MWLLPNKGYAKCFTSILSNNPTLLDRGDDDDSDGDGDKGDGNHDDDDDDDDHDNIHFIGKEFVQTSPPTTSCILNSTL